MSIVLLDRSSAAVDAALASLPATARCQPMVADVTSPGAGEEAVQRALDVFGRLDVLVNAAGVEGPIGHVEDLDEDAVRSVFEVNVFALLSFSTAATRHFRGAGSGRIINLASGAGLAGTAFMAAYSASKHAVIGLTRSMAAELGRDGIPVNAVCPGCVESPMMTRIESRLGELGGTGPASFVQAIPMARYCDPAEVAQTVVWLAMDAPPYITGSALVIDGGLRA